MVGDNRFGPRLETVYRVKDVLELNQTISPPRYNSIEDARSGGEAIQKAWGELSKPLSRLFTSTLKNYVSSENSSKPLTDGDLVELLMNDGFEDVCVGDVILAREKLDIKAHSLR